MLDRIRDGRTDLVFDHLAGGGAVTDRDERGVPLIRWCAYYGDVSAVRYLVANGEVLATLGDNLDLNGAAFHGHWRLVQFLIEQGADADRPLSVTGETPLHAALSRPGRPAQDLVVELLLAAGADPNARAADGAETGAFMRDARTRGETPLHRAAAFGSEATLRRLTDAGADLEARDSHGATPLSWASWHLRPAAVLRLLCHGDHALHPDAHWTGDHGAGWSGMDLALLGRPHIGHR
jgi:ankyrin repeat protein